MNPALEETIVLDFITSGATGAAVDADALPTAQTFEDSTDTDLLATTVTKRAAMTGNYRVAVTCTAALGFEAGKSYNVIASATVGGIAAKAPIGTFQIRTTSTDSLCRVVTPANALSVSPAGIAKADVNLWIGVAPAALSASGYVQSMLRRWLTDNAAGTPLALYAADAGNVLRSIDTTNVLAYSTCQVGSTAGTIVLHAGADANDDFYNDCIVGTRGGTASGQVRLITDYVGATRTCTVTPNWNGGIAPDGTTTFIVYGSARVDTGAMGGSVTQATYLDQAISTIPGGGSSITGVINDATPTASSFVTNLASTVDDIYRNQYMKLTSGTYSGIIRRIATYNGTTKAVTFYDAWPTAPANGVTFSIIADDPSGTPTTSGDY